jgi:hypothetical protein
MGDTLAGIKRIVQLDSDVARLRSSLEKAEAVGVDHEKRLIRIETMIEFSRNSVRLPPR